LWDKPSVKLQADECGRITSAELFKPKTVFDVTVQPDGSIRLVELQKESPILQPERTRGGFLIFPAKVSRETVRAAIRADRDAQ
jgi:hypothetical protein